MQSTQDSINAGRSTISSSSSSKDVLASGGSGIGFSIISDGIGEHGGSGSSSASDSSRSQHMLTVPANMFDELSAAIQQLREDATAMTTRLHAAKHETMKVTATLRNASVNVLGMPLRKVSLILGIKDMRVALPGQTLSASLVAPSLLDKRCYVNWPYLQASNAVATTALTGMPILHAEEDETMKVFLNQQSAKNATCAAVPNARPPADVNTEGLDQSVAAVRPTSSPNAVSSSSATLHLTAAHFPPSSYRHVPILPQLYPFSSSPSSCAAHTATAVPLSPSVSPSPFPSSPSCAPFSSSPSTSAAQSATAASTSPSYPLSIISTSPIPAPFFSSLSSYVANNTSAAPFSPACPLSITPSSPMPVPFFCSPSSTVANSTTAASFAPSSFPSSFPSHSSPIYAPLPSFVYSYLMRLITSTAMAACGAVVIAKLNDFQQHAHLQECLQFYKSAAKTAKGAAFSAQAAVAAWRHGGNDMQLRRELAECRAQMEALELQLSMANDTVESLQDEADAQAEQLREYEEQLNSRHSSIVALEFRLKTAEQTIGPLRSLLDQAQSELLKQGEDLTEKRAPGSCRETLLRPHEKWQSAELEEAAAVSSATPYLCRLLATDTLDLEQAGIELERQWLEAQAEVAVARQSLAAAKDHKKAVLAAKEREIEAAEQELEQMPHFTSVSANEMAQHGSEDLVVQVTVAQSQQEAK